MSSSSRACTPSSTGIADRLGQNRSIPRTPISSLCVFCGSSPGADPAYADAAATLGRELAGRNIRLVYGGGSVGLMGIMADAALEAGGDVLGVITEALLDREVGHLGATVARDRRHHARAQGPHG